jgi:hypothetical protein
MPYRVLNRRAATDVNHNLAESSAVLSVVTRSVALMPFSTRRPS